MKLPDFDHDGDINMRDYYDDLGGVYYFAPDDVRPGKTQLTGCEQNAVRIISFIIGIAAVILLFWIL